MLSQIKEQNVWLSDRKVTASESRFVSNDGIPNFGDKIAQYTISQRTSQITLMSCSQRCKKKNLIPGKNTKKFP